MTISTLLLVLLGPILLFIALMVRLNLGAPVLFRDRRPGFRGKPFTIYKFRTMTNATDEKGNLLPDSQRTTFFGNVLRSSSLDELPELLNVLRGEMSLVGPRPLLLEYLGRYSPEQMRRHDVLPGITGWAQINGRTALTWEKRFMLDVWYVDHLSFWLDIKIYARTIAKILKRESIGEPGKCEPFLGQPSGTASLSPDRSSFSHEHT